MIILKSVFIQDEATSFANLTLHLPSTVAVGFVQRMLQDFHLRELSLRSSTVYMGTEFCASMGSFQTSVAFSANTEAAIKPVGGSQVLREIRFAL